MTEQQICNILLKFLSFGKEEECIKLLKEYPFLLNYPIIMGNTTIFLKACRHNFQKLIDYLLQQDIDIHHKNGAKENAVHYAVASKHLELVQKLYQLGIALNEEDSLKNTPFLKACFSQQFNIMEFLIKQGADINHMNERGGSIFILIESDYCEEMFPFALKHLDKFNEENQKRLKKIRLKYLVEKGEITNGC